MKHSDIIKKMTLEQKANIVSGYDYWHLEEFPELDLPKIMVTDGPHGLRKQNPNGDSVGLGNSYPATSYPTAATSSCSWDLELITKEGEALGNECLQEDVSVLLGPGTNIKRSPTCGRNFEYFSEDPYLAGKCSAALIKGVQSKGIGTSLKHFAVNSQEAYRMIMDELVDERTLREIYLTAFEIAIKEAQPWTVMNSYNRINGVYASQNNHLQEEIARGEWGFEGLFVTDWGSSVDRIPGLYAGTDLEMPSSGDLNPTRIVEAVKNGSLEESVLDKRVDNVVDLIVKSKAALAKKHTYSKEEHHKISMEVAEGSIQLLKNNDGILPVKQGQKVAVIGEMAKAPRFQGAGSSVINPTQIDNAYDALVNLGVDVVYAQGYDKKKDERNEALFSEAVEAAKSADVVLVFAGLTEEFEGEGYDRKNIEMPSCHNLLISEVAKANPNTAVVLAGGSVITMPWINEVKGVLNSGLSGQAGGTATAKIIAGVVNPSGKTSETYPLSFEDNPTYGNYLTSPVTAEHREAVYIGYRYYDKAKKNVLFPFGHGLSYTTFEYGNLSVSSNEINDTDTLSVSFTVKNTGAVAGAEVAQLYVADKESTIFRPEKELREFAKVFLAPGEEKTVEMKLSKRAFAFYNVNINDWCVETGEFDILVGASSRDIRLQATVKVNSTVQCSIPDYSAVAPNYYNNVAAITKTDFAAIYGEIPSDQRDISKKIDIYNCLEDASHTKWGGRICRLINKIMAKFGSAENGDGQMLAAMATQIPIRNFIAMSMGVFTPKMADGLLMILNDGESAGKGLCKILAGIPKAITKMPALFKAI